MEHDYFYEAVTQLSTFGYEDASMIYNMLAKMYGVKLIDLDAGATTTMIHSVKISGNNKASVDSFIWFAKGQNK